MTKLKVVTGYIPIKDFPRSAEDYGERGEKLRELKHPIQPFYGNVSSTWMYQMIECLKFYPTWAIADDRKKNTLAYHCVQHQKFGWLSAAKMLDTEDPAQMYVWIDYGILHVPGVTPEVIQKYLARIDNCGGAVTLPGCWLIGDVPHDRPCWRFCGGLMAVPSPLVKIFTRSAMGVAMRQISATRNVEWEVNTLARLEALDEVPMKWYKADHDQTMFTGAP